MTVVENSDGAEIASKHVSPGWLTALKGSATKVQTKESHVYTDDSD